MYSMTKRAEQGKGITNIRTHKMVTNVLPVSINFSRGEKLISDFQSSGTGADSGSEQLSESMLVKSTGSWVPTVGLIIVLNSECLEYANS